MQCRINKLKTEYKTSSPHTWRLSAPCALHLWSRGAAGVVAAGQVAGRAPTREANARLGGKRRSVGEGHGVARELDRLLLEEGAEHEVLEAEVALAPRGARGRLLREEARRGEHAQPAVRELLLLHLAQLGRVGRLEPKRVEVQVARRVPGLERLHVGRVLVRVGPADLDAVRLADADAERADEPEPRGQLRDLLDRRPAQPVE